MLEITSVGAKVKYAFESASGVRPTSGYKMLPDVNEAPEQDMSLETIDVSNITDEVTRYAYGRQDPSGDQAFTLNHTDAVIEAWEDLVAEAEAKQEDGLQLWFEYAFPSASKSYYWAGVPRKLGTSGIQQNALDTIPAHVVLTEWEGWAAKSAVLTASASTASVTGTGTATITLSNKVGDVTVASADEGVCTASITGTTITITGVAAGTAYVTATDAGNGEKVKIKVTVTAAA